MKKAFLLAALPLMLMTSCLDDVGDTTASMPYSCAALLNADDDSQLPVISDFKIGLSYNYTKQNVEVSLSSFPMFGGTLTFETAPIEYTYYYFKYGVAQSFSAAETPAYGIANSVKDLNGSLTSNVANPYILNLPDIPLAEFSYSGDALIMSMKVGEHYSITTLPLLAYYKGVTTQEYTSAETAETVTTSGNMVGYRVAVDPSSKKATIAIQNIKLKDSERETSLFFKDLNLIALKGAYKITGENLKPMVYDGAGYKEQETLVIPELTFVTTDAKLTEATISLTTSAAEKIDFSGTYLMQN